MSSDAPDSDEANAQQTLDMLSGQETNSSSESNSESSSPTTNSDSGSGTDAETATENTDSKSEESADSLSAKDNDEHAKSVETPSDESGEDTGAVRAFTPSEENEATVEIRDDLGDESNEQGAAASNSSDTDTTENEGTVAEEEQRTGRDAAAEAAAVTHDENSSTVEVRAVDDATGSESEEDNEEDPSLRGAEEAKTVTDDDYIELALIQVDYDTRYLENGDQRGVLHIFGVDEADELLHVEVHNFEPYFYVPYRAREKAENKSDVTDVRTLDEDGDKFETIRGERVVKVCTETPRDVGQMRDDFDRHWEADIRFPNRFMIDKDINSGVRVPANWEGENKIVVTNPERVTATEKQSMPRVHMMDIEVEDRNGFPEADDAEEPIICLTSHDSVTDRYNIWVNHPGTDVTVPDTLDDFETLDENAEVKINTFETEAQMAQAYLAHIDATDPSILTGWNFDDFDAAYFVNRLEKLNEKHPDRDLSPERLSRIGTVWNGYGAPDIKGRIIIDLLHAYKRTKFTEMESYRLDAVGENELGVPKEHYEGDLGDLWEENPERLLEYNLRDVEICVELDRQQDILQFWNETRTFVGCKIEDAPTPGDACDMYVMHKVFGDYVLPSKGEYADEEEEFEGGAVFEPISGVVEDVSVLDLKSLYPMSMCSINASPETKVDPEEYDGEMFKAPNDVYFRKDEDGIIREMVNELLEERERLKAKRNEFDPDAPEYEKFDRQQASVKVIMNSLYGVLGWDRFRLYDAEMSAAVTATGREVIKFTEKVSKELGYTVTYGDTDSVMLSLKEVGWDDIDDIPQGFKEAHPDLVTEDGNLQINDKLREAHPNMADDELRDTLATVVKTFEIEEIINDRYDDFAREKLNSEEHRFLIEAEKLYKRFLQAGKKKRYAGRILWKEGKHVDNIDITGFEYQRSDIAPITKKVQKKVIKQLVTGADASEVKSYVHETVQEFRSDGDITIEDIGIPGGIGQSFHEYASPGAHPRGAMYANVVLGTNFGDGSKPKRVYLRKVDARFWQKVEDEKGNLTTSANFEKLDERDIYNEFKRQQDVICYEYPEQVPDEFLINWEKMLAKTLRGPISRVLRAVDISWEDAKTGQEQTGLGSFMT